MKEKTSIKDRDKIFYNSRKKLTVHLEFNDDAIRNL
jgi:hypothetical protein